MKQKKVEYELFEMVRDSEMRRDKEIQRSKYKFTYNYVAYDIVCSSYSYCSSSLLLITYITHLFLEICFAIVIDNCEEVKLEEDGTKIINDQAKSLKKAFDGVGFCVLYFNSLSSELIAHLLLSFRDNVDHSQLSAFVLVFLSKGQTPQLYDANNEVVPFDAVFQFFYNDELPLAKIPKMFLFDLACLDDQEKSCPSLPQCPEKSVVLAVSHHTLNFSPAINTLSNNLSRKSIQDLCKEIHQTTDCFVTWDDTIHNQFKFENPSNEE